MKIFITGATGFVGQAVTAAAMEQGHSVRAVVRPSSDAAGLQAWVGHERFETASVDLRDRPALVEALRGTDTVIHLAATKAGDFYSQFAGTVVSTENLLLAMAEANVKELVGVSTFSVYEYLETKPNTLIDEDSKLVVNMDLRDEYTETKMIQEELYNIFGRVENNRVVILRPGMIFGSGELWHSLLGSPLGPRFLRIGSSSTLPMTYVDNCADAIVAAADKLSEEPSTVNGEVINIVDDNLPTQKEYAEMVSKVIETPKSVTVPWPVVRIASGGIKMANQKLVGGRAKFPGIAVPDRLHARFKPLRYTNAKAKHLLGWSPRITIEDAINKSAELERQSKRDSSSIAPTSGSTDD